MRKKTIIPVAFVTVAGALGVAGPAFGAAYDIDFIDIDSVQVRSDGDATTVRGNIGCDRPGDNVELPYGMAVKVTQQGPDTDFESDEDSQAEGVIVAGPNGPQSGNDGVEDDQGCIDTDNDSNGRPWDVLVPLNNNSNADFDETQTTGVQVAAGTSGDGAPGAFIGDLEFQSEEVGCGDSPCD